MFELPGASQIIRDRQALSGAESSPLAPLVEINSNTDLDEEEENKIEMAEVVLIVEDEQDLANVMEYNFLKEGYQTRVAGNGKTARFEYVS